MARQIPGVVEGESVFVPDVTIKGWKNRDDPDPIKITLNAPTAAGLRAFYDKHRADDTTPFIVLMVTEYITAVESYLTPAGNPIKTAADLVEYGEWPILEAVSHYIMGITPGEKKTSETPSE